MNDHDPMLNPERLVEQWGLKYKNEEELLQTLLESSGDWDDSEKAMLADAFVFAKELHSDDSHRDLPYTFHLLRNASRAIKYLHEYDAEVITAIILHDSVEDHPKNIIRSVGEDPIGGDQAIQRRALVILGDRFSERVANLVGLVTNEPSSTREGLTKQQKLDQYAAKVDKAIQSYEGWVIKFVDWVDNGVGILHGWNRLSLDQRQHFKRKYGYVAPILKARFEEADIQDRLDADAKKYIHEQFALAEERLTVPV